MKINNQNKRCKIIKEAMKDIYIYAQDIKVE